MMFVHDTKKDSYRSRNWLMKLNNGMIISFYSAIKLVENSIFSWDDLFSEMG